MWLKTLVGLLFGLILAMSLFVTIGYFVPMTPDILLFSGYVGIFFVWAGLFCWFYSSESLKQPMKVCIPLFLVTALLNALQYTGVLS